MPNTLIKNARIVNENQTRNGHVFIENGLIREIFYDALPPGISAKKEIDLHGKILIPGAIDDQVHFRQPGLRHKAEIQTESKAAAAGGITSFMDMPNVNPQTTTQALLEEKFRLGAEKSFVNYSFYIGATNDNIDQLTQTDPRHVCGIKVFMGSSTGNMLVNNPESLNRIFAKAPLLVATHCEDEEIIRQNTHVFRQKYGENMPIRFHADLRSAQACYKSSSLAVSLARRHAARLHVLHLSTAREMDLFENSSRLREKPITAEVCVHHLTFNQEDYDTHGTRIKWNPAVKTETDRQALLAALRSGKIDVVATDHAPHTLAEKQNNYFNAPSGAPLVQHALPAMLELYHQKELKLEQIVEKMCHAPAEIFQIAKRGYIRKGYHADLVALDLNSPWKVSPENVLYKCGWSPFEGKTFRSRITHTLVNGNLVYENGNFDLSHRGEALRFER